MTTPPDVLRRQIMLTVYGARPELGTDGAGEVADALLAEYDVTPREAQDGADGAEGGSAVHGEGSGAPAGSQGVTNADRQRAVQLLPSSMSVTHPISYGVCLREIAAALAEERAKARAPFLALADVLDVGADNYRQTSARIAVRYTADCIRRAAEEPE